MTLADALLRSGDVDAGTPLWFHSARGIVGTTRGELSRRARSVATALRARDIGAGDVVAVQLPNCVEAAVAYEAVLLAGATLLPIAHIYGAREVEFIARESGAKMLIQPERWRSIDYSERLPVLLDLGVEVVVVHGMATGATPWTDFERGSPDEYETLTASTTAVLCYTSGTTSAPKGVQHSADGLVAETMGQSRLTGTAPDTVTLVAFPFGHMAGLVSILRPLIAGNPTVVMDGWDPAVALDLITAYSVTMTAGAPLHLATLCDALEAGADLGSLREYLVGGATVPADLIARADRLGICAYRCYGSTEHPTVSCGTVADPLEKRQFTDGRPTPGTEIRILDENHVDTPIGVDGEVVCRGPETFLGYRDAELDADTWLPGGWLRTGDIGNLDADGYLTITDRAKDVIIRGGETISSREVEDVLLTCPRRRRCRRDRST